MRLFEVRFLLSILVFVTACGQKTDPDIKVKPVTPSEIFRWVDETCGRSPQTFDGIEFEMSAYMQKNNIVQVGDVPRASLIASVNELRNRLPEYVNDWLVKRSVQMRLMWSDSMANDPFYDNYMKTNYPESDRTSDTRLAGVSYGPNATVLVNHFVGKVPSVILHERGHNVDIALDFISWKDEWFNLSKLPAHQKLMARVCAWGSCLDSAESFAETFAIYYACPKSRTLLSASPQILEFLERLDRVLNSAL